MKPRLTIILGGARSGKSAFAEGLVQAPRAYIATAQAFDAEMSDKITKHIVDRGEGWLTIETPTDIAAALQSLSPETNVLIDCLTLWLSNLMLEGADVDAKIDALLQALVDAPQNIICVSNEVGMGLVPDNSLGRQFRDYQGTLNRKLAAQSDLAVFVVAGLPMVLKGQL